VLKERQVTGHLGGGLRDAAQRVERHAVGLPRVGLSRHRELFLEAELGRDAALELTDLAVVAAEQLEERRLRSRRALATTEAERLEAVRQLLHVEGEVLHPERRTLAHRGELRRLEVGVRQARDL